LLSGKLDFSLSLKKKKKNESIDFIFSIFLFQTFFI
jgi:hypothetical protein